jgi:hypothetical protein
MSLLQFAISCSSPILMYPSIDVDASIKIVKLLLDAGANPFGQSIAGIDGDPPQRINSAREHLEKLKYPNFIKERLISLLEEAKLRWTPQRGLAG